jgi:hypothetical protein
VIQRINDQSSKHWWKVTPICPLSEVRAA